VANNGFTKFRRQATDHAATVIAASLSALVVGTLFAIFAYLVIKGASSLNWTFLTQTPKPVGEAGGGMANCLFGSVLILLIASALGLPVGRAPGQKNEREPKARDEVPSPQRSSSGRKSNPTTPTQ